MVRPLARMRTSLAFLPVPSRLVSARARRSEGRVMKVCISEFPDDEVRHAAAWEALVEHVAAAQPELVVLPEMPFCEWIFVGHAVEPTQWGEAVDRHDRMIERLGELGAPWVVSSRPIDHIGRRFNEAYLWSARTGYQALRRKWYLPDAPRAKE